MPYTNTCIGIFENSYQNLFENVIKHVIETHTGLTYIDFLRFYEASELKMEIKEIFI